MSFDSVSRREFAKRVAAGAAVSVVGGTAAAREPSEPNADRSPDPERSLDDLSEADLVVELIRRRYPSDHLTPEVLDSIAGDVAGDLARGRILSRFPLANSDEPAFVFSAYRPDR